ncbi:divergent polysaccharide deacetylase family protein [Kaarinaea lacus]
MNRMNAGRQGCPSFIPALGLFIGCLLLSLSVDASEVTVIPRHPDQPAISIIIDDMGYLKDRDSRALRLPGNITYSFLPHTPYARELATQAHELNKEVMLHQPMEALSNDKLGPGALTLAMTRQQFLAQLQSNIDAVPYVVGINNHMGSLLTQHPGHMRWLMQELGKHNDLYFVDSYTTKTSIGQKIARENWIPTMRRDVFLDSDRDPAKIRKHFRRLIRKAEKNGFALAIGHPYPETMAILEEELPELNRKGIALLPVSQLLERSTIKITSWRASLSQ